MEDLTRIHPRMEAGAIGAPPGRRAENEWRNRSVEPIRPWGALPVRPWLRCHVATVAASAERCLIRPTVGCRCRLSPRAVEAGRALAVRLSSLLAAGDAPPLESDDDPVLWAGGVCSTVLAILAFGVDPRCVPVAPVANAARTGVRRGDSASPAPLDVGFDYDLGDGDDEEEDDPLGDMGALDRRSPDLRGSPRQPAGAVSMPRPSNPLADAGWLATCRETASTVGLALDRPPALVELVARTVQQRAGITDRFLAAERRSASARLEPPPTRFASGTPTTRREASGGRGPGEAATGRYARSPPLHLP